MLLYIHYTYSKGMDSQYSDDSGGNNGNNPEAILADQRYDQAYMV